jgi:preprotein translocase subunit SecD
VDANVLINERIREEQRRGRKVLDALETGYREAVHGHLRPPTSPT